MTPRHWVAALHDGDAYALRLRDEFLDRLSQGLAMLVMSLDPDRIVLGTIIRENTDLFLDELRQRTRSRIWKSVREVEIVAGELGAELPARAALSIAFAAGEGG